MPANVIVIYHGQQLSFCEDDVKVFVKATGYYRIAAYQTFDSKIESVFPLHDCCKNCAKECNCGTSQQCTVASPIFELDPVVEQITPTPTMGRPVSESDKRDLESALVEILHLIIPILNVNVMKQNVSQDYRKQLITDLMERSHTILTVTEVIEHLPLFSITHALKFLEVFDDIANLDAIWWKYLEERNLNCLNYPSSFNNTTLEKVIWTPHEKLKMISSNL